MAPRPSPVNSRWNITNAAPNATAVGILEKSGPMYGVNRGCVRPARPRASSCIDRSC